MKKTTKPTPEHRVRELYPAWDATNTVELFITQLDLTEPNKKTENVVLFTKQELIVWRGGEIGLHEKTENIERVCLGRGVGCCWL